MGHIYACALHVVHSAIEDLLKTRYTSVINWAFGDLLAGDWLNIFRFIIDHIIPGRGCSTLIESMTMGS